jgi:hypothetical protein
MLGLLLDREDGDDMFLRNDVIFQKGSCENLKPDVARVKCFPTLRHKNRNFVTSLVFGKYHVSNYGRGTDYPFVVFHSPSR